MTQIQTYDPDGADVDLAGQVRLASDYAYTEIAELGAVGESKVTVDDMTGVLDIVGLKDYVVDDDDATAPRILTATIDDRDYYEDDSLDTGSQRKIDVSLVDLNARLGFRLIQPTDTDGNRPAESAGDRLTWILGSDYLSTLVFDNGFVTYPSDMLDKADFRNQYPGDVIGDTATQTHRNYFVYWDPVAEQASLWFRNSKTSTSYPSSLRLTNAGDDDSNLRDGVGATQTWAMAKGSRLRRSPKRVYTGASMPYAKGSEYRTRPATADTFAWRDGLAPNSNVKTAAQADAVLDEYLEENSTEEDRISCAVELPAENVNDLLPGQWFHAKFRQFAEYSDFSQFRVMRRSVTQPKKNKTIYRCEYDLMPAVISEGGSCFFDCTPSGEYYPLGSSKTSEGVTYYLRPGLTYPLVPTPGFVGDWNFGTWGAGGPGTVDQNWCSPNEIRFILSGSGTMVIHTLLDGFSTFSATVAELANDGSSLDETVVGTGLAVGADLSINIEDYYPRSAPDDCLWRVVISGTDCRTVHIGYTGMTYTSACDSAD